MIWMYSGFVALILVLLALDLGVFHRKAHVVSVREALGWSAFWIALGLLFTLFVYAGYEGHWFGLGLTPDAMGGTPESVEGVGTVYNDGSSASLKYITGYLVEKSLSIDNIFVISMIFSVLAVPAIYQHRVLFWGIVGALVMRGMMIGVGSAVITEFAWIIYVFGGFLILTGIKMLVLGGKETSTDENLVLRLTRKIFSVTDEFHGEHFFVKAKTGALVATPLFLALVMVEFTDVIFAVDSIPAIFAITGDPFIVFTSNVFALLGLRSLYFALAGMVEKFRYLKISLALILILVGIKMMAHGWLKSVLGGYFNFFVLGTIMLILAAGVGVSWIAAGRDQHAETGRS
jgi:tellurite resistance protein TerC